MGKSPKRDKEKDKVNVKVKDKKSRSSTSKKHLQLHSIQIPIPTQKRPQTTTKPTTATVQSPRRAATKRSSQQDSHPRRVRISDPNPLPSFQQRHSELKHQQRISLPIPPSKYHKSHHSRLVAEAAQSSHSHSNAKSGKRGTSGKPPMALLKDNEKKKKKKKDAAPSLRRRTGREDEEEEEKEVDYRREEGDSDESDSDDSKDEIEVMEERGNKIGGRRKSEDLFDDTSSGGSGSTSSSSSDGGGSDDEISSGSSSDDIDVPWKRSVIPVKASVKRGSDKATKIIKRLRRSSIHNLGQEDSIALQESYTTAIRTSKELFVDLIGKSMSSLLSKTIKDFSDQMNSSARYFDTKILKLVDLDKKNVDQLLCQLTILTEKVINGRKSASADTAVLREELETNLQGIRMKLEENRKEIYKEFAAADGATKRKKRKKVG